MKLIEQIRELISRGEIKDASTNLLEDIANAVWVILYLSERL